MEQGTNIEVYRQRYETFRHLDKLRWQMLQILVAVGSISVLMLRATASEPERWFVGAIGAILLIISNVMFRINAGIRANGSVLREIGKKVGDDSIPNVSNKWKSSSHWTAIFVLLIGLSFLAYSVSAFF